MNPLIEEKLKSASEILGKDFVILYDPDRNISSFMQSEHFKASLAVYLAENRTVPNTTHNGTN